MPNAAAGFFEQKRSSPTGFGLVVLGHAALIAAVIMIKGPVITRHPVLPTVVDFIEVEDDPPPVRPPETRQPEQETHFTQPTQEVETFTAAGPTGTTTVTPPPPVPDLGLERIEFARVETITPAIRREATILSGSLQPPYPTIEQRAQRGGLVRLRVHIGPDGRVVSVERISATSNAFWAATRQHALDRWRFRPATLDGRPVESSKVMTVTFRIEDI